MRPITSTPHCASLCDVRVIKLASGDALCTEGVDDGFEDDDRVEGWDGDEVEPPMPPLPLSMRGRPLSEEMEAVLKQSKASKGRSVRSMVSLKKRRYQRDGFDLDLTYITDRVIAMGFPCEGRQAVIRNTMRATQNFLEMKHSGRYRVYNLCCEPDRTYDYGKFGGNVARFGFEDHNAAPLALLLQVAQDMGAWVAKHPDNVCAVHCKAGKGRTGTVICAYLCYAGECANAAE